MDVIIKFSQAAFKHGISEADIRWAVDTAKYDGYLEDHEAEDKRVLVGFDRNANPLEIFYNILNNESLLQKSVTFARLLQFLRLKPCETCVFQRLLLQNWSFATAS
jgi:hypothetical protein